MPMALATVALLDGSPAQLQSVYGGMRGELEPWTISPDRISNLDQRQRHLGDVRYVHYTTTGFQTPFQVVSSSRLPS